MQLRSIGAALALVLLSACGGGGGGGDTVTVPNAKQGGLYTGTITPNGQPTQNVLIGMVSETGESRLLTDVGTVFSAQLNTNGSNIAGNFTGFADGGTFANGRATTTGTLAGTVAERSSISASYAAEANDRGSVALRFNALYNQPSSLATIAGTFGYTSGSYTVTYTISNTGAVSGSDTSGCTYSGNFSLVNASFNVYRLSATTNCATGTFTGLASYSARVGTTPDQILFVLTSNTDSFVDVVDRK